MKAFYDERNNREYEISNLSLLPECIAFDQSPLRHILRHEQHGLCHTVFSRGFQRETLLWFTCKTMYKEMLIDFYNSCFVFNAVRESLEIWMINCDILFQT